MARKKPAAKKTNKKKDTTTKTTKKTVTKEVTDEVEYLGPVEHNTDEEEPQTNEEEEEQQAEETEKIVEAEKEDEAEEPGEDREAADDNDQDKETDENEDTDSIMGEVEMTVEHEHPDQPKGKRQRGPTKLKNIAKDPSNRVRVDFNDLGEPVGPGSVLLSSYLGPLVREHVPVVIENWRKITEEMKTVLWMSIQARFEISEEYQKAVLMKQMGSLWRASKSRLVSKILNEANTMQERMKLRPKNVTPLEWRKFVKLKTSPAFKVVSDSYKARRQLQIPHTSSRKGMVRLADDMKKESVDPSSVTRIKVWVKSRTRKDGTPVNIKAAEKFRQAAEILDSEAPSQSTNPREDELTQLLGPDNPGRIRAMGRTMNMTKLACFEVKKHFMTQMEENQFRLMGRVSELEGELAKFRKQRQEPEIGENSTDGRSVKSRTGPKCVLVDWDVTDDKVAVGRLLSTDPKDLVNGIPLGPNAVKVLVESAIKPEAFLWRPGTEMYTVDQTVGEMIAWPLSKCVIADNGLQTEDISQMSPTADVFKKCKLLDWAQVDEVVVAEGRWECEDPNTLVNGLPLGPSAVKVFVDVVHDPETFLWRPTKDKTDLSQSLNSFIAWPAKKCVLEESTTGKSSSSRSSPQRSVSASPKGSVSASPKGLGSETPKFPASASPNATTSKQKSPPPCPKPPLVKKSKPNPQSPPRRSQRHGLPDVPKENQKCRLMDIGGKKQVVAEGKWATDNPEERCHFVPLGEGAVKVWVDVVKVKNAAVWRPSSEIECMGDALGSAIAWPKDKVTLC